MLSPTISQQFENLLTWNLERVEVEQFHVMQKSQKLLLQEILIVTKRDVTKDVDVKNQKF